MRRNLRGFLGFAVVLMLAGCASIPTSGAVNAGVELGDSNSIELDILARGPQDGDSQEQILDGFLAAAASPQLDYRIAREFLTTAFSSKWKPDTGTTVDRGADRNISATGDTSIALRIHPTATVSSDGNYQSAPATAAETRNFSFERVAGQWRISAAPQGIVIDQATFGIVFGAYSIQFFSPSGADWVPDVRWFARRETTQTAIVRALVAGPSEWLKAGVVTAVPNGARLDADSVPVNGSTATVNLAVDTVPSADALSRLQAQIRVSLSGVRGITEVNLAINGTLENVTSLVPQPTVAPSVDGRPAVLTASDFGFVDPVTGRVEDSTGLANQLLALDPDALTLGPAAAMAAARTAAGVFRLVPGNTQLVWSGSDWGAPAVDAASGIWASRSSQLVSWQGVDGGTAEFATGWGDAALRGIAVSRDGTRIAAVLQTGSLARVVVSAISRGGDGSPIGLGQPALVTELDGEVSALSWTDPSTIALLQAGADATLTLAVVGGQSTQLSAPDGAVWLASGNNQRELTVLDSAGQVLQPSGASWQVRAVGIRALAQQTRAR